MGLKISTFWRAIWARRRRRISSSVLPLYMLPTITSIQPVSGRERKGSDMGRRRYGSAAAPVNRPARGSPPLVRAVDLARPLERGVEVRDHVARADVLREL